MHGDAMWNSTQSVGWLQSFFDCLIKTTINAANCKLRRHWQQIARLSGNCLISVIQLSNISPGTPGSQKACASPQAQGRDHTARKDSILHKSIPQAIRHADCDIWYNYMHNRYMTDVCLNGQHVQDFFGFSHRVEGVSQPEDRRTARH